MASVVPLGNVRQNRLLILRVLFVVNNPAFFVQQHLPVAVESRRRGNDVHIAAPDWDGADEIRKRGFPFHPIRMARGRINPVRELLTISDLLRLYRRLSPDLVHHLTHKSVLYGTLSARIAGIPAVLNANTGLGYVFIDDRLATRLVRQVFRNAFRLILRHPNQIDLFLNPDDRADFAQGGMTRWDRSAVVSGPGVDPTDFPFAEAPHDLSQIVVLPGRLLAHKGVREFVAAAKSLIARGVSARFVLVGGIDRGNRASISSAEIDAWVADGVVEHWGYRRNMASVFRSCSVCVLPSYREGLGRVLIEAASTGRPLVAFDVPGCREVVVDGFNGLLVERGDVAALADAIERLLNNRSLRERLGDAGRTLVVERFAVDSIVDQTLAYHDQLLGKNGMQTPRDRRQSATRKVVEVLP